MTREVVFNVFDSSLKLSFFLFLWNLGLNKPAQLKKKHIIDVLDFEIPTTYSSTKRPAVMACNWMSSTGFSPSVPGVP